MNKNGQLLFKSGGFRKLISLKKTQRYNLMQKFTIKTYKDTRDYEICDYPYADTWQYLKITKYHKGKYCGEESIDLSEINPETVLMKKIGASFLKSEKIPAVKKIL